MAITAKGQRLAIKPQRSGELPNSSKGTKSAMDAATHMVGKASRYQPVRMADPLEGLLGV
jgi:hypothetical protein